jgi:voltage-gated potassium channel
LRIIAKAINEESVRKLKQVGADSVVMPNFIGGLRMASEMIRPSVVSFLDVMLRSQDVTVRVEEIGIPVSSKLVGKSLADSALTDLEGVTVVAICDDRKAYSFNPPRSRMLAEGDVLIVMGVVEKILKLKADVEAV